MSQSHPDLKRLALVLPDIPRWVEVRALLQSGDCELFGLDEKDNLAFVISSAARELVYVVGHPATKAIQDAVASIHHQSLVVAAPDNSAYVADALPRWKSEPARIHLLKDSSRLPATAEAPVRLLALSELETATLLPFDLKEELMEASRHSPIAAALVEGFPVSFCHAAAETESLWDISIDTLACYRNRGYAGLSVSYLIEYMGARGKSPVWGAEESNIASIKLARKLGFESVDQWMVFRSADRD